MSSQISNNYFDNDTARDELVAMQLRRIGEPVVKVSGAQGRVRMIKINRPSNKLIEIIYDLQHRMAGSTKYNGYDQYVKEEMVSKAMMDFINWGHNYDPSKSAYSFLTACTENSFKRVLKHYYRDKNLQETLKSALTIRYHDDVDILEELYLEED